jgi:protein-S-isoprenylcysteine O-methyltransferase Ste14
MTWKRYFEWMARIRVPSGFLLAGLYLVLARPSVFSLAFGAALAFLGILLRAFAAGHLEKNCRLSTSGPYAYTRNPLYLGSALAALGFTVAGRVYWMGLLFAAYLVAVYLPVVREEESHLAKLFPEFRDYAAAVPRFLPAGRRLAADGASAPLYSPVPPRFRWSLYWKNREYNAFLGYFLGLLLLIWKVW